MMNAAFPMAGSGDQSQAILFESVGRFSSTWEWSESYLAMLYARLLPQGTDRFEAARLYGNNISYSKRMRLVRESAEDFLVSHGAQSGLSPAISSITDTYDRLSKHRNNIVHGLVQPFVPSGFVVMPPWHATRYRELIPNIPEGTKPVYAYSSKEIEPLIKETADLQEATMQLITCVVAEDL